MGNIAISADNIGKMYKIGTPMEHHDTLRDLIVGGLGRVFRNGKPNPEHNLRVRHSAHTLHSVRDNTFWALRNVSFEVKQGEVLGVIGRNGAGKSTLFKILSRITEPTEGRVKIYGRVGSLLEVGTGFHPELSGRENVYLNGAILGMRRSEIDRKFDEIVAFSEIEKFIDTPVKRYSSGMYVRLAFAVAAHLEPEVFIVDEVLAVGDAEFQKKCLGKMGEVAKEGRTVLFVSHNLAAVERLCDAGLIIDAGQVRFKGEKAEAIKRYAEALRGKESRGYFRLQSEAQLQELIASRIVEARVTSSGEFSEGGYKTGDPLEFHIDCVSDVAIRAPTLVIGVDNWLGQRIVTMRSSSCATNVGRELLQGRFGFVCSVKDLALAPGEYRVELGLEIQQKPVHVENGAMTLQIMPGNYHGAEADSVLGIILCKQHWEYASWAD